MRNNYSHTIFHAVPLFENLPETSNFWKKIKNKKEATFAEMSYIPLAAWMSPGDTEEEKPTKGNHSSIPAGETEMDL